MSARAWAVVAIFLAVTTASAAPDEPEAPPERVPEEDSIVVVPRSAVMALVTENERLLRALRAALKDADKWKARGECS